MDDFVISNLHESRNEWCARLVSILSPLVIDGVQSIFEESWKLCLETDEVSKYLMTFQNLLSRIPKWNGLILEEEVKRIIDRSGCNYLEDLISCVHIIQLKVLTCIRVGNRQKRIDISIPKLEVFVHKVYIHCARKLYMNVYLFEKNVSPLQKQKHMRETEIIVQECILTAIRESIPTEDIIKAYMEESVEHEEEVVIENIGEPVLDDEEPSPEITEEPTSEITQEPSFPEITEESIPTQLPAISDLNDGPVITSLQFNDFDSVRDDSNNDSTINAPKNIERLESISTERAMQRKMEEDEELDDKIQIHTDNISLDSLDIMDMDKKKSEEMVSLDDIIELV